MTDYNPADEGVEDVKAYVEKNPLQLESVLKAEKDGKNRVTLVSFLEEQLENRADVPVAAESPAVVVEPAPTPGLLSQFDVTPERGHRRRV